MLNKRIICILLISLYSSSMVGMTFDNDRLPLLDKYILRQDDTNFFFRAQPFVFFADSSSGGDEDDDTAGLFEIGGKLEQNAWDQVLLKSGAIKRELVQPNLGLPFLKIPWNLRGRLDAGGLALRAYYALTNNIEIGGSWFVMGLRSRLEAILQSDAAIIDQTNPAKISARKLSRGDVRDLQSAFNSQRKASELEGFLWSRAGVSDLDLYLRFASRKHYFLKCKRLEAALKLGVIVPTAAKQNIHNPASIPFGGNGFWGTYADFALDSELRDDMFAGFNIRFIQRLGKTDTIRLPLMHPNVGKKLPAPKEGTDKEEQSEEFSEYEVPLSFNPLIGKAHVSPGFTFVFYPYFAITNYRDGFGAQLSYTLSLHTHDTFKDLRMNKEVKVDFDALKRRSSWASEYVTFGVNYDFAKDRECRGSMPMLFLDVDYPVHFFASKRSNKTFGVSLRIESNI